MGRFRCVSALVTALAITAGLPGTIIDGTLGGTIGRFLGDIGAWGHPQEIGWAAAVARLALERELAMKCAGILKQYGDPASVDRARPDYDEAKVAYDRVFTGLWLRLYRREKYEGLSELAEGMWRGFYLRDAFCRSALPFVPKGAREKGLFPTADILRRSPEPLIMAVVDIYKSALDDDTRTIQVIITELRAAEWPQFDSVQPVP